MMTHARSLLLPLLLLVMGMAPHSTSVTRWALIVGVGDYLNYAAGEPGGDLPGASRDARYMYDVLTQRWGFPESQVRLLLDLEATHDNIRDGLTKWLPSVVRPGDVVVFYFAGHGSQVWDQDKDEADGLDETICPTDVLRKSSKKDIRDDQLRSWLKGIPTTKVTVILDSCNSGTATRGAPWLRTRMLSRDAEADLGSERPAGQVLTRSAFSNAKAAKMDVAEGVLEIASAQAGEAAVEGVFEGFAGGLPIHGGAFTIALVRNLWQVPIGTSYQDVFALTVEAMKQQNLAQRPQLSNATSSATSLFEYTETPILAAATVVGGAQPAKPAAPKVASPSSVAPAKQSPPASEPQPAKQAATVAKPAAAPPAAPAPAPVANEPLPQGVARVTALKGAREVTLGGGRAAGIVAGAVFRVGANWLLVRESTADHAVADVVTAVQGTRGIQPVAKRPEGVEVGALATLEGAPLTAPSLRVSAPDIARAERDALRAELEGAAVELLADRATVAHLQLEKRGAEYRILGVDGSVRYAVPRNRLAAALRRELASHRIARLENPAQAFPLELAFGGPSNTLRLDEVVEFRVRAGRDGYLTIVDLDPAGAATVVFPNEYDGNNRVTAGTEVVVPTPAMGFQFRAQEPAGRGLIRVFVTDRPLEIAPTNDAVAAAEALRAALLRAAGSLPLAGSTATPVRTWGTAAVSYEILR